MDEKQGGNPSAGGNKEAGAPERKSRQTPWTRLIRYVKRELHKHRAAREKKKAQETPADRAARRTANATYVIAVFTIVLAVSTTWTLVEIHRGGVDTHALAIAAGNQAKWTQSLAGAAGTQSGWMQQFAAHMKDVADRTKEQADRTKDLADEAKAQASAAKIAADAAKSAADTAKDALHVSERAYLTLGAPTNDFQYERMDVPVFNGGHIPSGPVQIVTHEATFSVKDVSEKIYPTSDIVETHWQTFTYQSVPIVQNGGIYQVEVHFPNLVPAEFNAGKQAIVTLIVMTYNDGFPGTPEQSWMFCDGSTFAAKQKLLTMRPCQDPNHAMQILLAADHYPDPQYEMK